MGFIIRGFIWDIPILMFAYVLFLGPEFRVSIVGAEGEGISGSLFWGRLSPKPIGP